LANSSVRGAMTTASQNSERVNAARTNWAPAPISTAALAPQTSAAQR
jgi:hypothetical protein